MREELQKKVNRAISLIQSASKIATEHGQPLEVAYSGGKDSDVILELTKMANVPYRAIYKNTTIDPPGTIKHAQEMGAEMIRPQKNFFQLVAEHGFPNMFYRFCCAYLKEYKVLDYVIIGVRREESKKRAQRYKEPEMCRVYSKTSKARHYMPILEWTATDIDEFINERGIKCAPIYYDERGVFHVERRLGCMGCPIARGKRKQEFKAYPHLVKAYIRAGIKFMQTHPDSRINKYYSSVYEWFVRDLFCDHLTQEEWNAKYKTSILPPPILRNF